MEIRKLLAVLTVVLCVPAFAALAFGQAASTDMGQKGAQSGTDAGSATDMEDTDMGTNAGSDQSLSTPQAPSATQKSPDQPSVVSPSGRESVVITPAPDSAVIVPGPSVVVPAPQQQMPSAAPMQQPAPAAVAPMQTAPAQPGGLPPDIGTQTPPRMWAPGGFVEPPQGPDLEPRQGLTPPPGYPAGPSGREMKAPGTQPITLPSTSVVVPGAALPGPATPGGMPAGAARQPMAPATQAPAAVQPAPSATQPSPAIVPSPARPEAAPSGAQPALPSDQQSPDIIIITPVPQGSSAPGTMQ